MDAEPVVAPVAPRFSTALPASSNLPAHVQRAIGRHDDLVLVLAMAVWLAAGGGNPANGFFEAARRRVEGAGAARHFVEGRLGQARDPRTIAVVAAGWPGEPRSRPSSPNPNSAPR